MLKIISAALLAAFFATAADACIGDTCAGLDHDGVLTGDDYDYAAPRRHGGLSGDNAYGPGVGMDQYGGAYRHDPQRRVQPNAYGLGVGMDQYGRPVPHDPFWN